MENEKQLKADDYQFIGEFVNSYYNLHRGMKAFVDDKIDKVQIENFQRYKDLCIASKEWQDAYTFTNDYRKKTAFNMEDNFKILVGDSNERYEIYSKVIHDDYIDNYTHAPERIAKIDKKLTKLNNKRFLIGKKLLQQHLENEKQAIQNRADQYTDWLQQDATKNEYLATKSELYQTKQAEFDRIDEALATQAITNNLQDCAFFACKSQHQTLTDRFTIDGQTFCINSTILDYACKKIRRKSLDALEQAQSAETPAEPNRDWWQTKTADWRFFDYWQMWTAKSTVFTL